MSLITKLKTTLKVLAGKIYNIKKTIIIPHTWYGNDYGGFFIADDFLNKNSIIYSCGVGEDISFDEAVIKKYDCKVFAFDPTPKSIKWVESRKNPENFHFFPFGIDDRSGIVEFLLPKNDDYVSGSVVDQANVDNSKTVKVPMKTLSDIVLDLNHSKIDVLKIDIEGSEYKILENILATPVEIKQILVEIHERFFIDGKEKTKKLLTTLKNNGYELFAFSNGMEELSFIKIKK